MSLRTIVSDRFPFGGDSLIVVITYETRNCTFINATLKSENKFVVLPQVMQRLVDEWAIFFLKYDADLDHYEEAYDED
jgi:hypothetical protein